MLRGEHVLLQVEKHPAHASTYCPLLKFLSMKIVLFFPPNLLCLSVLVSAPLPPPPPLFLFKETQPKTSLCPVSIHQSWTDFLFSDFYNEQ